MGSKMDIGVECPVFSVPVQMRAGDRGLTSGSQKLQLHVFARPE